MIKTGSYMVSAHIGSLAYSPEQILINGWLVQNNIEVLDKYITEVTFFVDYPAKISVRLEDTSNNAIIGNGILELSWTDGTNTKNFSPVEFSANSFVNNNLPGSLLGNLWPGGNYSIKLKDVLDSSSLRAYKEYNMSASGTPKPKLNDESAWDGTLHANETTLLQVSHFTLANSLLKAHLILDPNMINNPSLSAGYVELDNDTSDNVDHVVKWLDQSGKNNHATPPDVARQPVIGGNTQNNRTWIAFDGANHHMLKIGDGSICSDNFTIFIMAKPSQMITQPTEPSPDGISGTSGQHYLFFPEWGGYSDACQGLSLGTNGISNYEHADGYLPATALFSGDMSKWRVIAVKYEEKRPSIYVNSIQQSTGYQSVRTGSIYTPTKIGGAGGDVWNINCSYSGYVAAVLIYDTALNEANMKLVNDQLRNRFGIPEGVN